MQSCAGYGCLMAIRACASVNLTISKQKILGGRCWWILDPKYYTAWRVFNGQWHRWHLTHFWTSADGNRYFLRANLDGGSRNVDNVWNNPRNDWNDNWWFLVLATIEVLILGLWSGIEFL